MPVIMGGIETHTVDCAAIKLCARICENGYTLGDIGQDGCRKCSCKAKTGRGTSHLDAYTALLRFLAYTALRFLAYTALL